MAGQIEVDSRMVLEILPVKHRGAVYFPDRLLQFVGRNLKITGHIRFFPNPHQKLRRAQVAAGVQISGMAARCIGNSRRRRQYRC